MVGNVKTVLCVFVFAGATAATVIPAFLSLVVTLGLMVKTVLWPTTVAGADVAVVVVLPAVTAVPVLLRCCLSCCHTPPR